jgi:hypothetical protein
VRNANAKSNAYLITISGSALEYPRLAFLAGRERRGISISAIAERRLHMRGNVALAQRCDELCRIIGLVSAQGIAEPRSAVSVARVTRVSTTRACRFSH